MSENEIKRSTYLGLFQVIFIILCYFYISEVFGSISTPYISNDSFSIKFSGTLLLFGFLSILSGPIQGLIAGFIGELIYQAAIYNEIYLDWCLLIALIGFSCGIYRYKPLKYQEGMKIYYTFLIFVIISFILLFLLFLIQVGIYQNSSDIETIFINYSFKFFIQSLISFVFPLPIILFLYDRAFASREKVIYNLFLTHHPPNASDHTFYLEFGRTRIYFCSRCSGVIIGIIISGFIFHFLLLTFDITVSPELALLLCILLPLIGIIDWGTQKLKYRKSTTTSRLLTGFLIGAAMNLISFTDQYYIILLIIVTIYFLIFFLLVFLGNRKEMKKFKKELDGFESEEEI